MCGFKKQKKALTFYSQSLICHCNALVLLSFIILPYQTSALRFRGILRLDTECTPDTHLYTICALFSQCTTHHSLDLHCSLLSEYYSMIVATRPEPTVRPPSRYQTGVLRYTNSDFLCDLCGKIRIFRCVRVVFRNFCYHGVITVFLVFLAYFFLHS